MMIQEFTSSVRNIIIPIAIIAALVLLVLGLLPALLIAIYPIRSLVLRCSLGGHSRAALNIFVEKFYSCYRDGLDGGRDMRSFASLYLFLRMLCFLWFQLTFLTILFGVCCLVIALVRPYKKTYMNNIDVLILGLLTFNSYQMNNFINASVNKESTYSEFHLWSTIVTAYFPLLVVPFNILPCKHLFKLMKQRFPSVRCSTIFVYIPCNAPVMYISHIWHCISPVVTDVNLMAF